MSAQRILLTVLLVLAGLLCLGCEEEQPPSRYEVRGHVTLGSGEMTSTGYRLRGGLTPLVSATGSHKLKSSSYTLSGGSY